MGKTHATPRETEFFQKKHKALTSKAGVESLLEFVLPTGVSHGAVLLESQMGYHLISVVAKTSIRG